MNTSPGSPARDAWALIDLEKRRDRFIKRICIAAWAATLLIVGVFAMLVGTSVVQMMKGAMSGDLPWMTVVGAAMPLMSTLLWLFLLIAGLSTVGLFVRMRASTLSEIQLRLAALEELVMRQANP